MTRSFAIASAPDPFELTIDGALLRPQLNAGTKTFRTPVLDPGETTGTFIVAGQSNGANYVDATHSPTNGSKLDHMNPYDGGVYVSSDPLLGCDGTGGNLFFRVADQLITDGTFDRVILIPVACGSTSVQQWAENSTLYRRLIVASRRAAARNIPVTAFLWMQGESDTSLSTSQANYASRLATVIGYPRAEGFNAPWLIGKCSYNGSTTSANVIAAQTAAVNGTDIFAGGATDNLTGANRQTSIAHFTDAGADAAAEIWADAIAAVF